MSRRMLLSAVFILFAFLLSAPKQAPASGVLPLENSSPKLTAYHVGHLMVNIPESMEMRGSITLLPWILKSGIEAQIRLSEKKFSAVEAGERELIADFQYAFNKFNKSAPAKYIRATKKRLNAFLIFPPKCFPRKHTIQNVRTNVNSRSPNICASAFF